MKRRCLRSLLLSLLMLKICLIWCWKLGKDVMVFKRNIVLSHEINEVINSPLFLFEYDMIVESIINNLLSSHLMQNRILWKRKRHVSTLMKRKDQLTSFGGRFCILASESSRSKFQVLQDFQVVVGAGFLFIFIISDCFVREKKKN